jgi:hypothetical protein
MTKPKHMDVFRKNFKMKAELFHFLKTLKQNQNIFQNNKGYYQGLPAASAKLLMPVIDATVPVFLALPF